MLLPYRFKRHGLVLIPAGFSLWLAMQRGVITRLLIQLDVPGDALHTINVMTAVTGFFSFLAGLYFVCFSREKIEDEMIRKVRQDSFQFAALLQFLLLITGFLVMLLFREPGSEGMMLFFAACLLFFWLSFIGRFYYILYLRSRNI